MFVKKKTSEKKKLLEKIRAHKRRRFRPIHIDRAMVEDYTGELWCIPFDKCAEFFSEQERLRATSENGEQDS